MNRTAEVDAWMEKYDNPMKPVVEAVRQAVLSADPRLSETIKWQAPTFMYQGNLASFFPRAKKHATLMFHTGSEIPGSYPDLIGDEKVARTMKFLDLADVERQRKQLQAICVAWCELKDRG